MQAEITDTLNARSYVQSFSIATTALNKMRNITPPFKENHDKQEFSITELRAICFDNLFATYENFLEHLGYLLFDDWESGKKQRHYANKLKKLKSLLEATHPIMRPSHFDQLQDAWMILLDSFDITKYTDIRNGIKHTHAGKHDTKIIETIADVSHVGVANIANLIENTPYGITNDDCEDFFQAVNTFMLDISGFVKAHEEMFNTYHCEPKNLDDEQVFRQRQSQLATFCINPLTPPMFTQRASVKV